MFKILYLSKYPSKVSINLCSVFDTVNLHLNKMSQRVSKSTKKPFTRSQSQFEILLKELNRKSKTSGRKPIPSNQEELCHLELVNNEKKSTSEDSVIVIIDSDDDESFRPAEQAYRGLETTLLDRCESRLDFE